MIESRCGVLCEKCSYRQKANCKGCIEINKPFWGESCPIKSCCEEKKLEFCGKCNDFPCQTLHDYSYEEEYGDNGKRIEQCRKWQIGSN